MINYETVAAKGPIDKICWYFLVIHGYTPISHDANTTSTVLGSRWKVPEFLMVQTFLQVQCWFMEETRLCHKFDGIQFILTSRDLNFRANSHWFFILVLKLLTRSSGVAGSLWGQTTAVLVASIATILYMLAWACSTLLDKWLCAVPYIGCIQQMSHTWHALHLRCHQLLAWPFILLWGGTGYVNSPTTFIMELMV